MVHKLLHANPDPERFEITPPMDVTSVVEILDQSSGLRYRIFEQEGEWRATPEDSITAWRYSSLQDLLQRIWQEIDTDSRSLFSGI